MPHLIREQRIRQRLNWFQKAQELRSVTNACTGCGISRTTYDKWRKWYATSQGDRRSVADRSRRPHHHPRQVGTRMARRLRRWRQRTGYGPRRLAWYLRRKGVPSVSSVYGIHRVLQRAGLLTRHRTRPKHLTRYVMPRPGDCVQVDITYVPYRVEGRQVYQYTALDDCTRLRVVRFFSELTNRAGLAFLTMLRAAFPFRIQQVQTDNDATPPLQSVLQYRPAPWGPRGPDPTGTSPAVCALPGAASAGPVSRSPASARAPLRSRPR